MTALVGRNGAGKSTLLKILAGWLAPNYGFVEFRGRRYLRPRASRRPGRDTLYATFRLTDGELAAIRDELAIRSSTQRLYTVELTDGAGVRHALVEKTIHIRHRSPAG